MLTVCKAAGINKMTTIKDDSKMDKTDQQNNGDVFSRVEEAFRSPIDHVLRKYGYDRKGSSMSKHDHQFYSHYRSGHSLVVNPEGYWMHMREGSPDSTRVQSGYGAADMNTCLRGLHADMQYLRADDLLCRAASRSRLLPGESTDPLFTRLYTPLLQ
jgi:hypothetical protein